MGVRETDEVLERLWSILWTLTDEVHDNCVAFIRHGGCDVAVRCIQVPCNGLTEKSQRLYNI